MTDLAHVLFPSDAPASQATPAGPVATAAITPRPAEPVPAQDAAQPEPAGPDASKLFSNETPPDVYDGALKQIDDLAEFSRLHGDAERGSELAETSAVLLSEAREHEMPREALQEIVEMIHGAAGTIAPLTSDQITDMNTRALEQLSDVPQADLDLARGLISSMAKKMPTLIDQLDATGLGSSPKFIRSVVAEAKRRAGR